MEVQDQAGEPPFRPDVASAQGTDLPLKLAEAGWKYTPSLEYDDMTTCAYCDLALDGWERNDKP